jgi:predicted HicB family RNase H-like nuclease
MPVSKSQVKAQSKWESKAYDKILLRMKKGERAIIIETADIQGKSLNSYIIEAINEKLDRDFSTERSQ